MSTKIERVREAYNALVGTTSYGITFLPDFKIKVNGSVASTSTLQDIIDAWIMDVVPENPEDNSTLSYNQVMSTAMLLHVLLNHNKELATKVVVV